MTTLTVTGNQDYSGTLLSGVDTIEFANASPGLGSIASFSSSQFDNVQISSALTITGDPTGNDEIVIWSDGGTFDASEWTFNSWSSTDRIVFHGSKGWDNFIGSSHADRVIGGNRLAGAGYDTLHGGDGDDAIRASNGSIFGDAGNDHLWRGALLDGGTGDDVLKGDPQGGSLMTGGEGRDKFVLGSKATTITDFAPGSDRLVLVHSPFFALPTGHLDPSALTTGDAATTPEQHLIYNATTGDLSYDFDGSGDAAAVIFAHLSTGLTLSADDFRVI